MKRDQDDRRRAAGIRTSLLLALCLGLGLVAPLRSQSIYRTDLAGIDTVAVQVWISADDLRGALGLDSAEITTRVEVALRREGFVINNDLSQAEAIVRLSGIVIGWERGFAHYLELAVLERVRPWRNPSRSYLGKGWQHDILGTGGRSNARDRFLEAFDALFLEFLNDYLAANPRQR